MTRAFSSEIILIFSGVILLAGNIIVYSGGSFAVWTVAKGLYLIGVVLFVFNK